MRATPEQIARAEGRVGSTRAGYELVRLIGVGELGAVYRAESQQRSVALKIAHSEYARSFGAELADAMRVANEVGHPRAPSVIDSLEIDGAPAVVSELVTGENVEQLIRRRRGLIPPAEALRITADALEVISTAHARGIAHGSLSPAHLVSAEDGSIHVLGFGEAKLRRLVHVEPNEDFAPPESGGVPSPSNDLWAIGAILFPLLVGESAFANRRPRELGEIVPDVPDVLTELCERAIAIQPERRFRDAPTFLAALRTIAQLREICFLPSLRRSLPPPPPDVPLDIQLPISEPPITPVSAKAPTAPPDTNLTRSDPVVLLGPPFEPSRVTGPPDIVRADTHPALPLIELAPPSVRRRREADLVLGITTNDPDESRSLEIVLSALDSALSGQRTLDEIAEIVEQALARTSAGVACKVTSTGLSSELGLVSTESDQLAAIVERLFAAGIETLALLPGLDKDELARLIETFRAIATTDADPVNLLFDADFEHLIFLAPDPLAGIGEPVRSALGAARRRLNALVSFDSSYELEEAWHRARGAPLTPAAALDHALASVSQSVSLDRPLPSEGGRLLESETALDPKRLAQVATSSFEGPAFGPALQAFGPALARHVASLARKQPELALELVVALVAALRSPENQRETQRAQLVSAIVSQETARDLISANVASSRHGFELIETVLPWLGTEYSLTLAETISTLADAKLRSQILHHLEFGMSGHELVLGEFAGRADLNTALELLRLLARIDTLSARDALIHAAASTNPIVRIEALGHREGASSSALRTELRARLEAAPAAERAKILRAILDHEVRVASPFLALRVRGPHFDELPLEEKRLLFRGLARLAPGRAEKVALQILSEHRLLTRTLHEESRELAAETLGEVASSEDAVFALEEQSHRRWGASERVREAVERALTLAKSRLAASKRASR